MNLRFSIIVPVYNNPADLRNCIESLKALDYPVEDYEIIVVDNNSTDDTAAVATELDVTCLSETRFQSSYAARNTGIKAARGTFIAFTDSDCVADRGWLKAIDAVCGDEGAGCFAGEILSVEPTTTVERFSDRIGLLRQKGPLSGWHFKPYAQTANAVYRKSVFDQIGLFDPATNSGGDAAIAWRMLDKTTYTIRFVPEAIVYHHHRTSVPDLYAQFRRYGGGKMSWALSQSDYQPPAIAALEKDVVNVFAKHLEALEVHGVDDEVLFSGLKAATQAAQLSGYLQDLLRYTTNGAALEKAPAIARERAPTCNICGSHSFMPGPGERLANGRPPQCRECGSLERHRVVHTLIQNLDRNLLPQLTCVSIDEPLLRGKTLFKHHTTLPKAALRSSQGTAKYDVVLARSIFAGLDEQGFADALEELVLALKEESLLILVGDNDYEQESQNSVKLVNFLPQISVTHARCNDKVTGVPISVTSLEKDKL
jgi:glycosyltransferase involved in cell wall biosynthesis